mgnify:CR=1 FL=1
MDGILHIVSKDKDYWKNRKVGNITAGEDTLELTGGKKQEILGFGGCFNELGWAALLKTEPSVRENFIRELYGKEAAPLIWAGFPSGPMISAWNGTAAMRRMGIMS